MAQASVDEHRSQHLVAKAPTAHPSVPCARLWTCGRPQARLKVSACAAGVPGRETRPAKVGLRRRLAGNTGRSRANVAVAQSEARLEADFEESIKDWNNCNVSSVDLDEGGGEDAERFLLAAVDMGTNSFHMVVVRADMQGRFKVVDQMKEVVRLGSGGGKFNIISEEAEQRAFAAMKRLTKVAETRGAVLRVVATSAVREARNGSAFIRHIKEETGIEVETVSGQEEARLIYMGVLQALPVFDKTVLTVDIGGGSTEFVVGREGQPLVAMSLKIGHLRLAERCLGGEDLPTLEQLIECRRYVRAALADAGVAENVVQVAKQYENVPFRGFEMSVGTSGSIEICAAFIAAMRKEESSQKEHENGHPPELQEQEFKRSELKALVKMLSSTPPSQWKKVNGARDRHPHSVLAGAILLEEIFSVLKVDQMKISPYALREGVIVDSLMRALPDFHPTPDIRRESVLHLAQRFDTECRKQSALHSAVLARQILEGLKKGPHASKLALSIDDNMAFLMEAGTMLHFVGMFISHAGHHKHAYYLIKNNEHLLGFSPLEIEIIAMLARYHRKKLPSMKHDSFARLPPELREKITVMCVIIRLAVALDRRNTACGVNSVEVLHDGDTCVLVVVPKEVPEEQGGGLMDISLELWAARQELSNFSEVFGLATTVVEGHPEDPNVDRDGILSS